MSGVQRSPVFFGGMLPLVTTSRIAVACFSTSSRSLKSIPACFMWSTSMSVNIGRMSRAKLSVFSFILYRAHGGAERFRNLNQFSRELARRVGIQVHGAAVFEWPDQLLFRAGDDPKLIHFICIAQRDRFDDFPRFAVDAIDLAGVGVANRD